MYPRTHQEAIKQKTKFKMKLKMKRETQHPIIQKTQHLTLQETMHQIQITMHQIITIIQTITRIESIKRSKRDKQRAYSFFSVPINYVYAQVKIIRI